MSAPAALTEHKSVPRFLGEIAIKMAISSESKLIKSNAMIIPNICQSGIYNNSFNETLTIVG